MIDLYRLINADKEKDKRRDDPVGFLSSLMAGAVSRAGDLATAAPGLVQGLKDQAELASRNATGTLGDLLGQAGRGYEDFALSTEPREQQMATLQRLIGDPLGRVGEAFEQAGAVTGDVQASLRELEARGGPLPQLDRRLEEARRPTPSFAIQQEQYDERGPRMGAPTREQTVAGGAPWEQALQTWREYKEKQPLEAGISEAISPLNFPAEIGRAVLGAAGAAKGAAGLAGLAFGGVKKAGQGAKAAETSAEAITHAQGVLAARDLGGVQAVGAKNVAAAEKVLQGVGLLPAEIKMASVTKEAIKDYYLTKKPPVVGDVFISAKGSRVEITDVGQTPSGSYRVEFSAPGARQGGYVADIYSDEPFLTPAVPKATPEVPPVEPPKPPIKQPWEATLADLDTLFPRAGDIVDGRTVGERVANLSSIESSIDNPTVIRGIREVPMAEFGSDPPKFYSVTEEQRTKNLAASIKASGRIDPLIVAYDAEGPYILEGGHRFDALKMLGAKSFPAKVVLDEDSLYDAVDAALREGKPVRPEVLAEYSDLAAKYPGAAPPALPPPPSEVVSDFMSGQPGVYQGFRASRPSSLGNIQQQGGTWVAQNADYAVQYAAPQIPGHVLHAVSVTVRKPFVIQEPGNAQRLTELMVKTEKGDPSEIPALAKAIQEGGISYLPPRTASALREAGYDAVISSADYPAGPGSGPVMLALDQSNVRMQPATAGGAPPAPPPKPPTAEGAGAGPPPIEPGMPVPKLPETLQGTAEQAAQLRPPKPGYAGNIKLDKFPEPARPLIQQTVEENNQLAGMRGGVKSDETLAANAADLANRTSVEDILAKAKPGKAYTDEEIKMIGDTVVRLNRQYRDMLANFNIARAAGQDTPVMKAALAQKILEHDMMVAVRSGAAAEAGRSLRAFTLALDENGAARDTAIAKAFKLIGGTKHFDDWLQKFNEIDPNDTVAQFKMLRGFVAPTFWDYANYLRYNSILSSIKTHEVNVSSNIGTVGNRALEVALAGHPKQSAVYLRTLAQGVPDALAAAGQAIKEGATPEQMAKMEIERGNPFVARYGENVVTRGLGAATDLLSAEDQFFRNVVYGAELRLQAEKLGKTRAAVTALMAEPTEAMQIAAKAQAQRVVYTENPGEWVNRLLHFTNTPGPAGFLTKFAITFVRTPSNIYRRGLQLAAEPVTGLPRTAYKLARGDAEGAKAEAAKWAVASMLAIGFAGMAMDGRLTGQGPSNPAKRKLLEEGGWQANSIDIALPGDPPRWIGYSNLGPIAVPLATIAATSEGYLESKRLDHEMVADVTARIGRTLLDASYLQGLSNLFGAVTQGASGVARLATSAAGSFLPFSSGLAMAERAVDPTARATEFPGASIVSRIPGASSALPEQIGPYGEPRQIGQGDTVAQVLLPWRTSSPGTAPPDPVAQEVARLTQAGHSVSVRSFGDTYAGAKQTPEQQRTLQKQAGQAAQMYIADMMAKPEYQNLSDEGKASSLNQALGTAYQMADLRLGEQVNRDPRHAALLAWASVPHYLGVKGTPVEIREQNFRIGEAKTMLSEYRKRYGDKPGAARMKQENPEAYKLAGRGQIAASYTKARKKAIDEQYGGALTRAEREGLVGAGSTVLP